ncbi:MAG TPA: L-fuculose-phosphate aldolase [Anaerolineaceae bacterium]|jgi:L-fuculose-phosphate aldolase|nr:L-fuculose-phosphate aldolase [Anaerolineaceae bacterium]HNZ14812.1 L-fuculose-phosphate aldolase [Anaerolineaceae bacterium]HOH92012.1 L-fuculose-phosphate aldolase [Anaerolineaceae bacterium]HQL91978.1 L-fuculose-phosphate aldolase [Anaerolineaceae bacterium]
MILEKEREKIVETGKRMIDARLTTGTGGNLSIFNRKENLIAIKPSGVPYQSMRAQDVVVLRPDGERVDGVLKPSSETKFHLAIYHARPDVDAILHSHQVHATTIACMGIELPAVHYLLAFSGDKVPLAPYATFGTQALSDNILSVLGNYKACLLENHGLITLGASLDEAFDTAEALELVAQIYIQAKSIGEAKILNSEQMNVVIEKFKTYGKQDSETK